MDRCSLPESSVNAPADVLAKAGFVAINTIQCQDHYRERFECLFCSRVRAIDEMDGFLAMQVLKPAKPEEPYLVVSYWDSEDQFNAWVGSPAFHEGHKRAFEDLRKAKEEGREPPMKSDFQTYSVLAR
jgi:heme-degrading monooxygenase HmoA